MSKPDWIPFENNYVIVREFDRSVEDAIKYNNGKRRGPIAHETLMDEATTLRRAFENCISPYHSANCGRATIARLVFEDIPLDILMTELANHDKET